MVLQGRCQHLKRGMTINFDQQRLTKISQSSQIYNKVNIFVVLVGVKVWSRENLAELNKNSKESLDSFHSYRMRDLSKELPHDNAQLITGEFFDEVAGLGTLERMCFRNFSGGISRFNKIVAILASTIAHEMGHNLGLAHDTDECHCNDCVMKKSTGYLINWSSCSLEQLARSFNKGLDYCLKNKPTKLFESPTCGNGLVEDDEQCDCGLPQYCDSPCCDPKICSFHKNATCATGSCCDLKTCKFRSAGERKILSITVF